MIEEYLIEILLGINLTVVTSGFGYLIRRDNRIEKQAEENSKMINRMTYRMFGLENDDTDEGHLTRTEDRFDKIDNKLEEICQKIDKESIKREEQYNDLETRLEVITQLLTEEEAIEFKKEDIEEYQNSFQ
jgi:uncharacterized protein (DUF3084 family)